MIDVNVVQRNIMLTIANDKFSHTPSDVNFHNHVPCINRRDFSRRASERRRRERQHPSIALLIGAACTARVIGRSYAARCGRFREVETVVKQSAESAFKRRRKEAEVEDPLARLSIIATSSEESNYRPTNLITASEGATGGLGG